jgi:predicted nucleic acid-binding protein
MAALPDINVLLPLIYGAHVHHGAAVAWLNTIQEDGELVLCRVSQLGLLRLLNNLGLIYQITAVTLELDEVQVEAPDCGSGRYAVAAPRFGVRFRAVHSMQLALRLLPLCH